MQTPSDNDLGKALRAWTAYNHKEKKDRPTFNLTRWLKVVTALNGKTFMTPQSTRKPQTKQALYQARHWAKKNGKPLPPLE